jgi:hypothetical protein
MKTTGNILDECESSSLQAVGRAETNQRPNVALPENVRNIVRGGGHGICAKAVGSG